MRAWSSAVDELELDFTITVGTTTVRALLPAGGGTTVIVGPNGAGKTTILRSLLGDLTPDHGTIRLGERPLFSSKLMVDVPMEDRRIGYVPQRYALFPHLTVAANVGYGLFRLDKQARTERVEKLLEDFGIPHLKDRKPAALSGGEAQRVALARALAIEPQALLLDEPMGALDTTARKRVRKVLGERLARLKIPTVVVTHDPDDVHVLGERVAVIEAGEVVQVGTVPELRSAPKTDFVRALLGTEDSA
jgi:molybdate transport system ATP-binding protein